MTAVDSLEHIAPDDLDTAVLEMLRVAYRLVVIAVPSGEGVARQDGELAERHLQQVRGSICAPPVTPARPGVSCR
ncbi:MAG: hypothetical protein ACYDGS_06570 [Thermoleophilia bacterium]